MKKITSFTINHDYLKRGMYISRIDGDVITYDIRMKMPNNPEGDYLEDNALHTLEHLFATYVRNTAFSDTIIYVGPMGCRTGFYFLTRDTLPGRDAIRLRQECGNYLAHDLEGAKKLAEEMLPVLVNWTEAQLQYPKEVLA